jgi:exodeoxyribonuclease V alpha subunit
MVERITFYNDDNGWCVLRVLPDTPQSGAMAADGTVTVVGTMPELVPGEDVAFTGKWVTNALYGRQFKAQTAIPRQPENETGIVRYLSENVLGIGEKTARRIYDYFGNQTLQILDANPANIYQVPGLKKSLAENLIDAWTGQRSERQVMIYLQSYGVSSRLARRILDNYGANTLNILRQDPYRLAEDVDGIGFKRADAIAAGMGLERDSVQRLRAGLVYALLQLGQEGHTFAPRALLLNTVTSLLGIAETDQEHMQAHLREQLLQGKIHADKLVYQGEPCEAIYLPMYYHSERGSADGLRRLAETPSDLQQVMKKKDGPAYLRALAQQNDVILTDVQQGAVLAALTRKLSVLTGGPGTGKTTTLQMVINALKQESIKFELASPTGRAAKRLGEATGEKAQTIHRLLGWGDGHFTHDEDEPLKIDFLVVDEASMIDLVLFYNLLKALKPTTHLLLVGDVDQLPSVGAGNVLKDVIHSGLAHVTRLDQIFRQAQHSHIVTNAHRINHGDMPYLENQSEDFFFFGSTEPVTAADLVVDIVVNRLAKKLGRYDPINDVQVIAPMYRGAIGVDALNQALQQRLNPASDRLAEKRVNGLVFRVGDKVMQTKNNYEKEVFNGDIGRVRAFNPDDDTMEVLIDGVIVSYDASDIEQLIHAYCISTHRSQGSEYPVVVMPVMKQHFMMLQRNLLYTAITRARRMVVLVGDKQAIYLAVNNNKVAERYSGLAARLKK